NDTSTTYYKYAPGGGNGYEPNEPGPVQYYGEGNGLCGMPYNVFTVSIGNEPDARMHAIALTNTNNISYGVYTRDASKLSALFQMFVEKLQMASAGNITVIEPKPRVSPSSIPKPDIQGTISDMPFVVFADGFRSWNWSAPNVTTWIPWFVNGWSYVNATDATGIWWSRAFTTNSGKTLGVRVDAASVLSKLTNTQTTYTVKSVNVSFYAYGSGSGSGTPFMAFEVSSDNITWTTVSSVSSTGYQQVNITSNINPSQPFYIRFRSTTNNDLYLDDVMVLYVLDTTSGESGGGTPDSYTIPPAHYRFLTTPAVRVGTPYFSFWNYVDSRSYLNGDIPDTVVAIDYENRYFWLYNSTGAVTHEGNFLVFQNESVVYDQNSPLYQAPVTFYLNPSPTQDTWIKIYNRLGNGNPDWTYWYLPGIPHAERDMLIGWEDLWGTNSQIDADGDEWVRVTLLDDGTFRAVPYKAKGGYEHVFFIGTDFVYLKPHGESWTNGTGSSNNMYSEIYTTPSGARFPLFLRKSEGGTLSFYTKYSMTQGTNGGILYLWGSTDGRTWVWDRNHRVYLEPRQPYNGNLKMEALANESTTGGLTGNGWIDIDGKMPYWCFNGKSAGGTYGWEKIEVDLAKYVRTFAAIRIVFIYAQFGGVLPPEWREDMGWYIDDVQIRVRGGVPDYWKIMENATLAHSGKRFWYYNSPSDYLPLGVDSSLYTIPIDLTRAYRATLIAFFKFNINDGAGLPPDGVRIEVSKDNGETWYSITYGVRIGWGYTGRDLTTVENRGYYGITGDAAGGELPQRYSGVRGTLYKTNWTFVKASDANTVSAYDWVPSFTLVRLNCDLSGFAGNTIILRIRVFTNATGSETDAMHYASSSYDKGVFVDDVFVIGTSIIHGLQGGGEGCAKP
ncbi:MAG: hypothetical protein QXS83_01630, partial [Thermoplasmata archaeon]